ncbi:MAG: hypothetical protein AAGC74_12755, partial [Verrucomicrobiota bacterium]
MHIFKRVEVWVLIALLFAGIAYVLISEQSNQQQPPANTTAAIPSSSNKAQLQDSTPKTEPEAFTLKQIHLKRDYQNAIIEIDLVVHNPDGPAFQLIPPHAKLFAASPNRPDQELPATAERRPLEPFFLAFAAPP